MDAGRREPFTLIFRGPPRRSCAKASIHCNSTAGRGSTSYIMPIQTAGSDRQDYQALFN